MTPESMVLWKSASNDTIEARVAIAGDFLPAGSLTFPAGCGWREMAHRLDCHFHDISTTFLNLESPVGVEGLSPQPLTGIGQIVFAPADCLDYLEAIHSHAVGIANNHSYDFGQEGAEQTRSAVAQHCMTPLGLGFTLKDAPEIFVWRGPGEIRVGLWAAAIAALNPSTRRSPGVEPATLARASQALEFMKNHGAKSCIALLHAGCLRTNRPAPEDVRLIDSLAECGFHIVAASHSHRIAGCTQFERVHNGPSFCFYGLGSIVSGYVSTALERDGLMVVAGFNRHGELAQIEVRPLILHENGFGEVAKSEMSRIILERFHQLSGEIADGSYERHFYHDLSKGLLRLYLRDVHTAYRAAGLSGVAQKAGRIRIRHVRRVVHRLVG